MHFAPAPTISLDKYRLVISGLVQRPLTLSLSDIKALPATTIPAFHECYGPPTLPPTKNHWRVGCVKWTGVQLSHILRLCQPTSEAKYVWSDGLDKGTFQGVYSDRFRKDLPMSKASSAEVLIAYSMNGEALCKERGGPVRLVVPGWFGTNSTKWLCRLEVQSQRAKGEFVDRFYTEEVPKEEDREGWNKWDGNVLWTATADGKAGRKMRPVWKIQVNSMIVKPKPEEVIKVAKGAEAEVEVEGWAWSDAGVKRVELSIDGGKNWVSAVLDERIGYSWQKFKRKVRLGRGEWVVLARAECKTGMKQPLQGRRNHVHFVKVTVE